VSKVEELREEIVKSREELKSVFDAPAEDGKYSHDQKEKIKGLNEELAGSLEELKIEESKAANEKAMEINDEVVNELPVVEEAPAGVKTIGEQFTETAAYQNYMSNGVKGVDSQAEFKTTLNTTGYPPESLRAPGILETALRDPNAVIGLFDQIQTDQNAFVYLEETTFTNNAGEIAESGDISSANESALAFTERTESIRKIATFLPVTDELLADVAGIQGYVNSRLTTMMTLRMDNQLLNGDGSAPNLTGVLNKSGINTFAYGSYSGELRKIGQIYQAITEIRKDAFIEPDAVIMHPSDWYDIVTTTSSVETSGSRNPLFVVAGGFGADVAPTIWGLKVVPSTAIAEGTMLVGKFGGGDAAQIVSRQGVDLAVSDSHSDFFAKNQLAIRLTMRMGFVVYKPTAFCSITGM
jgi:HK97 family phage major capsid protein|tara:strand:- start:29 stop:1261 length:1233 start_codon:yes stop_codon:yes gene_type:complete